MRAGELRKRITIETPVRSADGVGEMVPAWSLFGVVWASIEPLSGNEKIQAQQVNANVDIKVTMRYLAGVVPAMRIRFGTRTFQIASVQNIEERNREMDLVCIEEA